MKDKKKINKWILFCVISILSFSGIIGSFAYAIGHLNGWSKGWDDGFEFGYHTGKDLTKFSNDGGIYIQYNLTTFEFDTSEEGKFKLFLSDFSDYPMIVSMEDDLNHNQSYTMITDVRCVNKNYDSLTGKYYGNETCHVTLDKKFSNITFW